MDGLGLDAYEILLKAGRRRRRLLCCGYEHIRLLLYKQFCKSCFRPQTAIFKVSRRQNRTRDASLC
eukprot:14632035-Heterocapsa_arctica.AAC.1